MAETLYRNSIQSPEVIVLQEKNVRLYFNKLFFLFSRLIYPGVITFLIASVTFPPGFGQFMAGEVRVGCVFAVLWNSLTLSCAPISLCHGKGKKDMGEVWIEEGLYSETHDLCYHLLHKKLEKVLLS